MVVGLMRCSVLLFIYLLFIDHITSILQTAGYIVYNNMVQQKYIHYNNKLKDKYYLKRNILYSLN